MKAKSRRNWIAAVATVSAVAVFGAAGGVGLAGGVASLSQYGPGPGQYQYGEKVTICHKGKHTIRISVHAWPAHKRHGDAEGATCNQLAKKLHAKKHAKAHGKKAEHARGESGKSKGNSGKGRDK